MQEKTSLSGSATPIVFDLKPAAANEVPVVKDVVGVLPASTTAVFDNYNIESTQVGAELCKEKWTFTKTS